MIEATDMSRRDLWRKLYERFDPELPAPMEWRAPRPHSPAKKMLETLDRPFGTPWRWLSLA